MRKKKNIVRYEESNKEVLIYNNSNKFSNDTTNQSNENNFINKSNPSY